MTPGAPPAQALAFCRCQCIQGGACLVVVVFDARCCLRRGSKAEICAEGAPTVAARSAGVRGGAPGRKPRAAPGSRGGAPGRGYGAGALQARPSNTTSTQQAQPCIH